MANYLMGIDVGTSGTKTVIFDEAGKVAGSAGQEYPLLSPRPGWTEQNPSDWWNATLATIKQAIQKAKVKPADIKGIGLSGQMHGSVFLDAQGEVVRPCLLWNDSRTAAECGEITAKVGFKNLIKWVGNPALAGFTLPKVVWLQKHEPKNWKKVAMILLPKDYVRYKLTGELCAEPSDAAGTIMYDVVKRQWSKPLLEKLGIPLTILPPVREAYEVCGTITPSVAKATGLVVGTPVVGGGADNACASVGAGIVVEGRVLCSIGTSGTMVAPSNSPKVDPQGRLHAFCHASENQWYLMGVVLSAGGCLQWYRNQFCAEEIRQAKRRKCDPYELLMEQAAAAPLGSEGLTFLPYLTGERLPHMDPHARGAWVGLSVRHGKNHLVRSIVEGVTFALRNQLEVIRTQGIKIKQIRLVGGGAASPFWRQLCANVFGAEIAILANNQGGAHGAAILAGVGAGVYKSTVEASDKLLKVAATVKPDAKAAKAYDKHYAQYISLYPELKAAMHRAVALAG